MSVERYQGTHPHVVRACEGTEVNAREAAQNPALMRLNSALGQAETHHVNGNADAARQVLGACGPIVAELRAVADAGATAYDDVAGRLGDRGPVRARPRKVGRDAEIAEKLDTVRRPDESDVQVVDRLVAGQLAAEMGPAHPVTLPDTESDSPPDEGESPDADDESEGEDSTADQPRRKGKGKR